jgi:hypothetical protein
LRERERERERERKRERESWSHLTYGFPKTVPFGFPVEGKKEEVVKVKRRGWKRMETEIAAGE